MFGVFGDVVVIGKFVGDDFCEGKCMVLIVFIR